MKSLFSSGEIDTENSDSTYIDFIHSKYDEFAMFGKVTFRANFKRLLSNFNVKKEIRGKRGKYLCVFVFIFTNNSFRCLCHATSR